MSVCISNGPTGLQKKQVLCPMCEAAVLVGRHCKTLCERCGYVESCEDNFLPIEASPSGNVALGEFITTAHPH